MGRTGLIGLLAALMLDGCVQAAPRAMALAPAMELSSAEPLWPVLLFDGPTDQVYQVERAEFSEPDVYMPVSDWFQIVGPGSVVSWRTVGPGLYRVRTRGSSKF